MSRSKDKHLGVRNGASAREVAQLAGVSQATVSRAFTAGASISPDLRARVLSAAEKIGYRPNIIARSLITSRTNIIGLVMGDLENPFYTEVIEAFSLELQHNNQHPLLFVVARDTPVDAVLPQVLQYQVDAIVIASATVSSSMAAECMRRGIPVILFNRKVPDTPTHVVATDNFGGGRLAARLLFQSGHRRFGYVAGHADTTTGREREQGFMAGLQALGVDDVVRTNGNYSYHGAHEAARSMLERRRRPDAIFCANDLLAFGVADAAREMGIGVPDELSIIGFDDVPQANWGAYQLTTLRGQVGNMVRATAELLTRMRNSTTHERVTVTIPARLVVRRSARLSPEAPSLAEAEGFEYVMASEITEAPSPTPMEI